MKKTTKTLSLSRFAAKTDISSGHRPLVEEPKMQLLLRIGFTLTGVFYFLFHIDGPLLINRLAITSIALLFCAVYFLFYVLSTTGKTTSEYIRIPFWLDIGGSFLVWFIDPLSPSPMLMFILVAAIGNGVHNGFYAFRNILWVTIPAAPLVYAARSALYGFHPSELILLAIAGFLLLYLYLVISAINHLQDKSIKKTADLVQTNRQLQKTGSALQESEARYRAMFEDSGAATVMAEEKTTLITLVNSKFEQLTGYRKNELCNRKRLSDLIDPDDMNRMRRFYNNKRMKSNGRNHPAEFECRMADKNGNIKYIVVRFGINTWHERLIITMVDVTAGRQSQIALQKYSAHLLEVTKKLQESGIRYRNLFENTGTATILVEKNLRIAMANSKFAELTGFLKKDILNDKRLTEFIEKRSLFRIRRFHARSKRQNLPFPSEYECLIRDRDKTIKHVIMKVYTPPDQENSIVSFFDITSRKNAEAQLQAAHEQLKAMAISDELTTLANRRHFNDYLWREWNRSIRELTPLSLILIDVDCFKAYNDTYGHQAGDQCLKKIAGLIKSHTKRALDLAARFGGEEFAVIMPNTTLTGAVNVAENIRKDIENSRIAHAASSVSVSVTISLGVAAAIHVSDSDPDALIKKADQALYEAKNKGRNRTAAATSKNSYANNLLEVGRMHKTDGMDFLQ